VNTWIRVNRRGRNFRITYDELTQGDSHIQQLLHELYEEQANLECMCQDKPVPMHIRRIRIRPLMYCLVTNKHYEHAEFCPRRSKAIRVPTAISPSSTPSDGSSSILNDYDIHIPTMEKGDFSTTLSDVERFDTERGMWVPSLEQLNPAQREAATHKDGPCIVAGAAGSGKTAMLMARIKFLVESGVQPDRILACTFTRKAADEMRTRLVHGLGDKGNQVTMGTIHSVAYRMIMPQLGRGWDVIPETVLVD